MTAQTPKIQFDPAFIEEAVFISAKNLAGNDKRVKVFHDERERIYGRGLSAEDRERDFRLFYERQFARMGLRRIFEKIVLEFPLLSRPNILIFVKKVCGKKEEESELYAQGDMMTVYIGIQIIRILDCAFLESYLRHEFMHISDMLDDGFQYSPNPDLGGKSAMEDNLIKERFRVLWNLYVGARLRRGGHAPFIGEEKQKRDFEASFIFLSAPEREKIFQDITAGDGFTHADLLKFAGDKRLAKTLGEGGLRCPLCHFTSYEPMRTWTKEGILVAGEIKKEYPQWEMTMGVCSQCFDMYYSKLKAGVL